MSNFLGTYDVGDGITMEMHFKHGRTREPRDPDAISVEVSKPGVATQVYTEADLSHVETGLWLWDTVATNHPGDWKIRITGTGAAAAVERVWLTVRA